MKDLGPSMFTHYQKSVIPLHVVILLHLAHIFIHLHSRILNLNSINGAEIVQVRVSGVHLL